jgi:energy-converting hydrogenase B subunit D
MNNLILFLNSFIIIGIVVSAVLTVYLDDLLSSIIALGVTGALVALEFMILHAPDVAIAEAAVGAVLSPVIFIVALKKVKEGKQ